MRLDVYLVKNGYYSSRSKAKEAILNGRVRINGKPAKAGFSLRGTENIEILPEEICFVSRGGIKLNHALEVFAVDCHGQRALDIGASTGGFTDCLLKRGAAEVVAVDVGKDQLAPALRGNSRVVSLEKTNIRTLEPASVGRFDLITIDVSFISLGKFFDRLPLLLAPQGSVVALIKPQFEAGLGKIKKGGIVKDPRIHLEVLQKVLRDAETNGFYPWGITRSPLRGGSGNREFFGMFKMQRDLAFDEKILRSVVTDREMQEVPQL